MNQAPYISIVIPARDEEQHLPSCLDSIIESLDAAELEYEIIVVANRCTDRTVEIAKEHGCIVLKDESKNLAQIRNKGVKESSGEIVATLDADSTVTAGMFTQIKQTMQTGDYVGGGVLIVPERLSLGILLSGCMLLPIALRYRIGGGLFFFNRSDFDAINGFNEEIFSAEDIDFARRLKAHGNKTARHFKVILRNYIITSCRKFDVFGDWYFVKRPLLVWRLLRNKDSAAADKIWYDFPR